MISPAGTLPKSGPGAFRNAVGWIFCLILAFVFILFGGMKLIGRLNMVQEFRQVGLGAVVDRTSPARSGQEQSRARSAAFSPTFRRVPE
jgi:hypothetical protein